MTKMRKQRLGCLVFVFLSLSIIVAISLIEVFKSPRENYHAIDFENDLAWRAEFFAEYQEAITENEDWVKDAETVALRVAGYPNDDAIPPESIVTEHAKDGIVVVTVLSPRNLGDSIERQETRVELMQNEEVWKVIWAGWRQQCARGILRIGWTTSSCS